MLNLIALFIRIVTVLIMPLDISEFKDYRDSHCEHYLANNRHVNGIENFWKQAKKESFRLLLKENVNGDSM